MIRYPITVDELRERIQQQNPSWLTRAATRTEDFRQKGRYDEASPIWGEIKEVFMRLQHDKCAYCEKLLEREPHGLAEHDIEHFRPKGVVEAWSAPDDYEFATGGDWSEGYYLLAYSVLNYTTACRTCNSTLKRSYFPIAGPRGQQSDDPRTLSDEQPLLIYPIGDIDDDPEKLIGFEGIVPVARYRTGHEQARARVTIDLFHLRLREELRIGRAMAIRTMWFALQVADLHTTDQGRAEGRAEVEALLGPANPHCSCTRAFHRLYREDPDFAAKLSREAILVLRSKEL